MGLPIRVRTSWISKEGVEKSRDLLTWNLAPNAGFEAAGALPGRALGWFQARSDTAGFAAVRRVAHHAGASNALSLVPDGGRTPLAFARAIPVRPGAFLLWRVRVTTEPGGNPIISVNWRDRTGRSMASEYPMQGNTLSTEEADYAGLLRVPSDARFLSLALGNWQAPGTVLWDDLLLLEVWPPTE